VIQYEWNASKIPVLAHVLVGEPDPLRRDMRYREKLDLSQRNHPAIGYGAFTAAEPSLGVNGHDCNTETNTPPARRAT
jgi:hypothetical protein